MNLDDERIRFYFRHREQIEEWAAIRSEAALAIDEWLTDLQPDIEAMAAEMGSDVRVRPNLDRGWPVFAVFRDAWDHGDGAEPPVCVALEWIRAKTTMRPLYAPYVGVRSATSDQRAKMYRQAVIAANLKRKGEKTSAWWVTYAYVLPQHDFPESAAEYRTVLLSALREVWERYAPVIDEVSAAARLATPK